MKKSKQIILSAVLLSAVVAKGQTSHAPILPDTIYNACPPDSLARKFSQDSAHANPINYNVYNGVWVGDDPWDRYVFFHTYFYEGEFQDRHYGRHYHYGPRTGGFGSTGRGHGSNGG